MIHIEEMRIRSNFAQMRSGEQLQDGPGTTYSYREERSKVRIAGRARSCRRCTSSTWSWASPPALDWGGSKPCIREACRNLVDVPPDAVMDELSRTLYDGVAEGEVATAS